MVTVRVAFPERGSAAYDVLIGHGLLQELPILLTSHCPAARYVVITDAEVERLYGRKAAARIDAEVFSFPAGEAHKTRETWAQLTDRMLAAGVGRDAAVVALGGGVAGDVGGFIAATYLRGIPCVQVPTTVLAMIDSSIGGKTGVDVPAGKNLVGAIRQPRLVVTDLDCVNSLPPAQFASGIAEAVKHGVIADPEYLAFLERDAAAILARRDAALERLVARSVEIKAAIVATDEHEAGVRAALNFGHTVGHAVEAASGFSLLHGEAVAIGMVYEARLGEALGITASGLAAQITALVEKFGLPVLRPGSASVDQLLKHMRSDKKVRAAEIRFALPRRVGEMHVEARGAATIAAPEALVREILAGRQ